MFGSLCWLFLALSTKKYFFFPARGRVLYCFSGAVVWSAEARALLVQAPVPSLRWGRRRIGLDRGGACPQVHCQKRSGCDRGACTQSAPVPQHLPAGMTAGFPGVDSMNVDSMNVDSMNVNSINARGGGPAEPSPGCLSVAGSFVTDSIAAQWASPRLAVVHTAH